MDDKVGLWVAIEALRPAPLPRSSIALFAVSTVQEEIGLRGTLPPVPTAFIRRSASPST